MACSAFVNLAKTINLLFLGWGRTDSKTVYKSQRLVPLIIFQIYDAHLGRQVE